MTKQILAAAALLALAGCASSNHEQAAAPVPQPPITAADDTPALPAPTPAASAANTQVAMSSTPSGGGTTYIVQHGDTLYKIARDHYGDGKAWSKISAANPQLSGTAIKPGQKLVLP